MLVFLRLLAVFAFLVVLLRVVLSFFGALVRRPAPRAAPPQGVAMVRDRVCNTFVPRGRALSAVIDGREEFFCSERCRTRALTAAPDHPPHADR